MRRHVGIAGLQRAAQEREQFRDMGDRLAFQQLEQLKSQLASFKLHLEHFARKYRQDIAKQPAFRLKFQQMCAAIGVDPLVSSKGYWGDILGNINDFYYDLAVRILEVGIALRDVKGPLIPMSTLLVQLQGEDDPDNMRGTRLNEQDICRAIELLAPLGGGYQVLQDESLMEPIVMTLPRELNPDVGMVVQMVQSCTPGGCTVHHIAMAFDWSLVRARLCMELLVTEGVVWVDSSMEEDVHYYWYWPELFSSS